MVTTLADLYNLYSNASVCYLVNKYCSKKEGGALSMLLDLLMQKMDGLCSVMSQEMLWKKHEKSFTQGQMVTHGGTQSNY